MILLDTNVLSALMRSEPEAVVVEWLDAQPSESIWTTSVTVFEIRTGMSSTDHRSSPSLVVNVTSAEARVEHACTRDDHAGRSWLRTSR